MRKDYEKFNSFGKDKKLARQCYSTVNLPLFEEDDSTLVLEKCVVPELHVLQGFVNHLFWDGLVPLLGEEKALMWPKKLNVVPKNYHGRIFEGNACRKLLKEADALLDEEIYSHIGRDVGHFKLQPFVACIKAMDKIVHACFSIELICPNLDELLVELKNAFLATELSQTLKIHVLFKHIKQSLKYLHGNGLGLWSEQAGESIHREFLVFWEKYKINTIEDSNYITHLKKAVVEFSSRHI